MSKSTPPNTTTKPKAGAKSAQSRARSKNAQGKTSASQADFKQERALTQKQEDFCIAYLETGNASEAYRSAYKTARMKPATVNRNAKAMLDNNKIATRLKELRQPAVEAAQMTLAGHLNDLQLIRDLAIAEKQYSAAIAAETNRGKASGLYTEKVEHSGVMQVQSTVTFVMPKHSED